MRINRVSPFLTKNQSREKKTVLTTFYICVESPECVALFDERNEKKRVSERTIVPKLNYAYKICFRFHLDFNRIYTHHEYFWHPSVWDFTFRFKFIIISFAGFFCEENSTAKIHKLLFRLIAYFIKVRQFDTEKLHYTFAVIRSIDDRFVALAEKFAFLFKNFNFLKSINA